MSFTPQQISTYIACCDERIASIQSKLDSWNLYNNVLDLAAMCYETEEAKAVLDAKNDNIMKTYKNNIQLVKVEKLIYHSLIKSGNGVIFPKLLQKYSDLMADSYDISGNMVLLGGQEQEHLEYCSSSLKQREFIEKLCLFGSRR
jgi:hypothetical protein